MQPAGGLSALSINTAHLAGSDQVIFGSGLNPLQCFGKGLALLYH